MASQVSAIISLYRGERYLPRFLENIAQQTWFDHIEFVIDHNSPSDVEMGLIKEFQSNYPGRLKHLIRQNVVPYGASWNRCIRESSADIVTIWNVDDLRTPESVEVQAAPILSGEADLVFGDHLVVPHQGETQGRRKWLTSVDRSVYTKYFCFGPFFMFRRSLCDKAGFADEQMLSSADFDLAVRLAHHGKIRPIEVVLGYYLNEGKGLSTKASSRRKVEDTVIGLRYGNLDRLYYHKLHLALKYDVNRIRYEDRWHEVSEFIPDHGREATKRALRSLPYAPLSYLAMEAYEGRATNK